MSIAWCGICDDLNTKFQASTYSSNYLRAPDHNFFPRVAKTFSLSYSLIIFAEEDSFLHNHPILFPVSETHFFTLSKLNETFQLGPSFTTISIRALKSSVFNSLAFITAMSCWYVDVPHFVRANTRHHEGVSIYLVVYDMYICVPSYFNNKMFTIYFVELLGRSRLHTNQKLVSLFFNVVEMPFFPLPF